MKPNKEQRHQIYTKAFRKIENNESHTYGLCYFINNQREPYLSDPYYNLEDYPEIYAYKPFELGQEDHFFPLDYEGFFTRLVILDNAIHLTK